MTLFLILIISHVIVAIHHLLANVTNHANVLTEDMQKTGNN